MKKRYFLKKGIDGSVLEDFNFRRDKQKENIWIYNLTEDEDFDVFVDLSEKKPEARKRFSFVNQDVGELLGDVIFLFDMFFEDRNGNIPKKKEITKKEEDVEKYLTDQLDSLGIEHIKGNPLGLKGFPDRIIFADHIYWIELKAGKELKSYYDQTVAQKNWETRITNSKGDYRKVEGFKGADKLIEEIKSRI